MGVPFFATLVERFLLQSSAKKKLHELDIIMDGFSLLYYLYDKAEKDKSFAGSFQLKTKKCAYDELWKYFSKYLEKLKEFNSVVIVLDGLSTTKNHRRTQPHRDSSIQFVETSTHLPDLLLQQFTDLINSLGIPVQVASLEADPLVAKMARETTSVIVGFDSDYFLYDNPCGYIPLKTIDFDEFIGTVYHFKDVFYGMNEKAAILWAVTINYDFIDFPDLQKELSSIDPRKTKKLDIWLRQEKADEEKCRWINCQYRLLEYIRKNKYKLAYENLTKLIRADKPQFDRLLNNLHSVIEAPFGTSCEVALYFNQHFYDGKLDRSVLEILSNREIRWCKSETKSSCLLQPIRISLMKWFHSSSGTIPFLQLANDNERSVGAYVFNEEPATESFDILFRKCNDEKRAFLRKCVNNALGNNQENIWDSINEEYHILLFILCLGFYDRCRQLESSRNFLLSSIMVYLKHTLFDDNISKTLPENIYKDKKYLILSATQKEECCTNGRKPLRESLERAAFYQIDADIGAHLETYSSFYRILRIINECLDGAYSILPPCYYVSNLTYGIAVNLQQERNPKKKIEKICLQNNYFIGLVEEIYQFVLNFNPNGTQ